MDRAFRILTWVVAAGTALAIANGDLFGIVLGVVCLTVSLGSLRYLKGRDRS